MNTRRVVLTIGAILFAAVLYFGLMLNGANGQTSSYNETHVMSAVEMEACQTFMLTEHKRTKEALTANLVKWFIDRDGWILVYVDVLTDADLEPDYVAVLVVNSFIINTDGSSFPEIQLQGYEDVFTIDMQILQIGNGHFYGPEGKFSYQFFQRSDGIKFVADFGDEEVPEGLVLLKPGEFERIVAYWEKVQAAMPQLIKVYVHERFGIVMLFHDINHDGKPDIVFHLGFTSFDEAGDPLYFYAGETSVEEAEAMYKAYLEQMKQYRMRHSA